MSDDGPRLSLEQRLAALRTRMEEGLPSRAALLRAAVERLTSGDPSARDELRRMAHKLRGTAGSHGHDALGAAAEQLELLAAGPCSDSALLPAVSSLIGAIREVTRGSARTSSPGTAAAPSEPISPALAGRRVLAIDDDGPTRRLLELTLVTMAKADARVIELPEDGISLLDREAFDIVIVDAMMPSMTGLTFAQAARRQAHGGAVPLVFLSAATHEELGWSLPEGTRWMRKPFRPRELLSALGALVAPPAA